MVILSSPDVIATLATTRAEPAPTASWANQCEIIAVFSADATYVGANSLHGVSFRLAQTDKMEVRSVFNIYAHKEVMEYNIIDPYSTISGFSLRSDPSCDW